MAGSKARQGEAADAVPQVEDVNPKIAPDGADNQIKDPDDWVTGDEPMTGAQASYLKTLSEQAQQPDAFDPGLSKGEASKRIDALRGARDQKS
jgi:hypothetical protein